MLQTSETYPDADLIAAFGQLRAAWTQNGELDAPTRMATLTQLRGALIGHADAFAEALNADFRGRSRHESLLTEVALVASAIDYSLSRVKRWARPRRTWLGWPHWPASVQTIKRGRGVVGIIGPSNYPLQLVLMPLIDAISAGCRALVKPSEAAPRTAELLQAVVSEALDPTIVSVVLGGPGTAAELSGLPLDMLLFSGSNRVGRKVALAAAANLTPTILELGGKSAVILDRGADLKRTAEAIIRGKLVNAGQTCVAPDYVLVPAELQDGLQKQLVAAAALFYPRPSAGDYSAILTDTEFSRLTRLESNHHAIRLFSDRLARPFFDPKLLVAPPLDSEVMREEIFGPLLPVIPYIDLDDAIAIVNGLPPALVLYWFGALNKRFRQVVRRTTSSAISVNETVIHAGVSEIPLGGIGASGIGRYHGRAGFDSFSHEQPVYKQARFSITNLMRPPFGRRADSILRRLLR